jgi:hypothetical protein
MAIAGESAALRMFVAAAATTGMAARSERRD